MRPKATPSPAELLSRRGAKQFVTWLRLRGVAARTERAYVGIVQRVGREIGPLLDEPAIIGPRLQRWRERLQADYERGRISASKARCDLNALRQYYDVAVAELGYAENPARRLAPVRARLGLPRPMPLGDVERLFALPDMTTADGLRDRVMLELLFHGLRRAEVAGLRTDQVVVDTANQLVTLRFRGKGDKEAEVVLHPASADLLARHLCQQYGPADVEPSLPALERVLHRTLEGQQRPLLVRDGREGPRALGLEDVNRIFRHYRAQAGLPDHYGPHTLRHTCATQLLEHDVDIRVVQEVLRHSDIRTTMRYTQVASRLRAGAMARLPMPAALLAVAAGA
jgi:integrase/recombinase XerD